MRRKSTSVIAGTVLMKTNLYLALSALGLLAACVDDEGPFERAGEEIDEAVEDVQTQGEQPMNQLDDAIDEARRAAEDVADEAGQAL